MSDATSSMTLPIPLRISMYAWVVHGNTDGSTTLRSIQSKHDMEFVRESLLPIVTDTSDAIEGGSNSSERQMTKLTPEFIDELLKVHNVHEIVQNYWKIDQRKAKSCDHVKIDSTETKEAVEKVLADTMNTAVIDRTIKTLKLHHCFHPINVDRSPYILNIWVGPLLERWVDSIDTRFEGKLEGYPNVENVGVVSWTTKTENSVTSMTSESLGDAGCSKQQRQDMSGQPTVEIPHRFKMAEVETSPLDLGNGIDKPVETEQPGVCNVADEANPLKIESSLNDDDQELSAAGSDVEMVDVEEDSAESVEEEGWEVVSDQDEVL